jgi:hypothetical protein
VMVPCTVWLLRRKRSVAMVGGLSCLIGLCIVFGTVQWFNQQLYTVKEPLLQTVINKGIIYRLPGNILRPTLETALFLLPILLMFLPAIWRSRQRALAALGECAVLGLLALEMIRHHHAGSGLLAPFLLWHGNYVTTHGLGSLWPMHCHYPVVLHDPVRWLLTIATIVSLVGILNTIVFGDRTGDVDSSGNEVLSWGKVCLVLVPFTVAYAALLLPFGILGRTLGKYLVPLLPVLLILLLRLYQERMRRRLPWPALVLVLLMGAYTVAATHDLFATYRGALTAINEMRAAGVPRTQIDGGWEYNGWTELEHGGYMHMLGARLPGGARYTAGTTKNVCPIVYLYMTPVVVPQYGLSFNPNVCEGPAGFAPVTYRRWLSPHTITVYVVKNPVTTKIVDYGSAMNGGPLDLTCAWGCDATKPMPH